MPRPATCHKGCGQHIGQKHLKGCSLKGRVGPEDVVQMGGEPPARWELRRGETDGLRGFLYLLLRDELPAGAVERLVLEIEAQGDMDEVNYCNSHLLGYAGNVALRLTRGPRGIDPELKRAADHIHALLRREDVSESDHQTDVKAAVEWLGRVGL